MKFNKTGLDGLYSVELSPITDNRGFFVRSFCLNEILTIKKDLKIVQINHSLTKDVGSIRGLHFQYPPNCETKIVRCIKGAIFDVAVDLRKNSKTYLQWYGELLSENNMKMLIIPEGFAHGFQTLEPDSEIFYLVSEFYNKDNEGGFRYDDPSIRIEWKIPVSVTSDRDMNLPLIDDSFNGIDC